MMKTTKTKRAYSCDTFLAQGEATKSGKMLFGKNSDRYMGCLLYTSDAADD